MIMGYGLLQIINLFSYNKKGHKLTVITFMLSGLSHFLSVREIILDNNFLSDESLFPTLVFNNAHVLSLNNNKVGTGSSIQFDLYVLRNSNDAVLMLLFLIYFQLENLNQLVQNVCQFFPNIR